MCKTKHQGAVCMLDGSNPILLSIVDGKHKHDKPQPCSGPRGLCDEEHNDTAS